MMNITYLSFLHHRRHYFYCYHPWNFLQLYYLNHLCHLYFSVKDVQNSYNSSVSENYEHFSAFFRIVCTPMSSSVIDNDDTNRQLAIKFDVHTFVDFERLIKHKSKLSLRTIFLSSSGHSYGQYYYILNL